MIRQFDDLKMRRWEGEKMRKFEGERMWSRIYFYSTLNTLKGLNLNNPG